MVKGELLDIEETDGNHHDETDGVPEKQNINYNKGESPSRTITGNNGPGNVNRCRDKINLGPLHSKRN